MGSLSAAHLIALWDPSAGTPPHRRLEPLVTAMNPDEETDRDTLGLRNRRLLAIHAELSGAPLEARLRCAHCHTDNEFTVPATAIIACKGPAPQTRVSIRSGRRTLTFRLPDMGDLNAVASLAPDDALERIVARCRLGGPAGEPVSPSVLARLATRFEELDPAAQIKIDLSCAECSAPLRATVDIAEFVAAGVDRIVERLFGDIHVIARAYGWSERAILALPPGRRRRYVAIIETAGPAPARAPLALRS